MSEMIVFNAEVWLHLYLWVAGQCRKHRGSSMSTEVYSILATSSLQSINCVSQSVNRIQTVLQFDCLSRW